MDRITKTQSAIIFMQGHIADMFTTTGPAYIDNKAQYIKIDDFHNRLTALNKDLQDIKSAIGI